MQFYIIHKDPQENARTLPDYAIKQVNVREGYQILSDIGHRLGVTWEGQNKAYNPFHPLTRTFTHRQAFKAFIDHFAACCEEYTARTGKSRKEIDCFWSVGTWEALADIKKQLPETPEAETVHYLQTRKKDKLGDWGYSEQYRQKMIFDEFQRRRLSDTELADYVIN